ncbi:hypothetical protein [uncultured Methanoregula sp.]|uniref:hypothetical protein n=1 Tax=uncultured Methanoregula sp. TaxID=1005933 RepID=UPI002AAA6B55|nr:hypothetical protein [uncultured Methanoregula sp.]
MDTRKRIAIIVICLFVLAVFPCSASVTLSSSTPQIIAKGNDLTLTGIGAINGSVALWIIGKNYIDRKVLIPDEKGNFTHYINSVDTRQFTSGQYAFMIQDPGPNRRLDVEYRIADNGDIILQNQGKTFADIGGRENLKVSVVPLISAFSSTAANPVADDIFIPDYFFVEDPSVWFDHLIEPIESRLPDVIAGNAIMLDGPTNLDRHDTLHAEIHERSSGTLVASSNLPVESGEALNRWSWTIESPGLSPGTYDVNLWRPNAFVNCTASAFFTVLPSAPATTVPESNTTAAFPLANDPMLPFIILFGLALVIASILFASRNR